MKIALTLPALAFAAGSTFAVAAPAEAAITAFNVYHSESSTQDASGLSGPILGVEAQVFSNVKGEFDGGTVTAPDGSVAVVLNQSSPSYPLDQFGAYFGPQPFGTFTANLGNSATLTTAAASLSYASDHYPDVAPEVGNYAALQHFDPTKDNAIDLTSGFAAPADATSASTIFFIYDETTKVRLLQYSQAPDDTTFDVPANTASPGEKIGFYFESDIDYVATVDGVIDTNIYRKITTGDIDAALANPVPEAASWAMLLIGFGGLALSGPRRRRAALRTLAAVALVGSLGPGASAQAAGLDGSGVTLIEDIPEEILVATQRVGSEVEFSFANNVPAFEIDVASDQIIFHPLADDVFAASSFNGFILDFSGAPAIRNVSRDPSSSFPPAPVSFTSDSISFNLSGLAVAPRDSLVLDVAFAPGAGGSSAPEPATWAMLLVGFAGLAFAGARRPRIKSDP